MQESKIKLKSMFTGIYYILILVCKESIEQLFEGYIALIEIVLKRFRFVLFNYPAYSSEELAGEIRKLDRINCELEEKIHALVEAINNLDDDYQCSKHDVILRRYLLLKCNLKLIFENENLR